MPSLRAICLTLKPECCMAIMSINTSVEIIGNTSLEGRHYHMPATGGGTLFIPVVGTLCHAHRQYQDLGELRTECCRSVLEQAAIPKKS